MLHVQAVFQNPEVIILQLSKKFIINSLIHYFKKNYSSDYFHENLESCIKDILNVR